MAGIEVLLTAEAQGRRGCAETGYYMQASAKPRGLLSAGGVLDRIVEAKAVRLEAAKLATPQDSLAAQAVDTSKLDRPRFSEALARTDRINIIAEIKHRSPSRGIICQDFDPIRISRSYESAGAAALSVLCEEDFFGGSLEHLKAVRSSVDIPVLRKDFIFDEYQVYEAGAAGAQAVLLIAAILDEELLGKMLGVSAQLNLDALVEIHSREEMDRAVRAGAKIFGVNNRDLTTFEVDLNTSIDLASAAPSDVILISESGISSGLEIRRLMEAGFGAFLIGERFMRAEDPGRALRELIEEAGRQ